MTASRILYLAALAALSLALTACVDHSAYDAASAACQQEIARNSRTPPPGIQLTKTIRCEACRPPEDSRACSAWWEMRMSGAAHLPESFPQHIVDGWRAEELVTP